MPKRYKPEEIVAKLGQVMARLTRSESPMPSARSG